MAAFATFTAADARAIAKMKDGTWVVAHAQQAQDGTIGVRLLRPMSPTNPSYGGWVVVTDDAAV